MRRADARGGARRRSCREVIGLLACGAALLPACAPTVYSDTHVRAGVPVREKAVGVSLRGHDKAWVLARLGPPDNILPRAGGDTFIYLDRNVSFEMLNLNAGLISPAPLSVYVDAKGQRRVARFAVYFDMQGRVRDVGFPAAEAP